MPAMRIHGVIVAAMISAGVPGSAQESPCPVIDVHVHASSDDPRWKANTPNPISGVPLVARNADDHRRATLAELRKRGVTKAVVSGDWPAVLKWKAEAPDLVVAAYYFEDQLPDLAFLRAEHAAGRLEALGEIAVQYQGMAPNDPRLEPYYAFAESVDIPVGIHIGPGSRGAAYRGDPKYRMRLTDPLALEDVLIRHPKLRLYVMHAAWPRVDDLIGFALCASASLCRHRRNSDHLIRAEHDASTVARIQQYVARNGETQA